MILYMVEILPGLWIGGLVDATNTDWLKQHEIECMISLTHQSVPQVEKNYLFKVKDNLDPVEIARMGKLLDKGVQIIHQHRMRDENVLVHCYAGRQRSATLIAAYLIRYGRMTLESAVKAIQSKKGDTFMPKNNFYPALKWYQDINMD